MITSDPDLGGALTLRIGVYSLVPLAATDAPDLLAHFGDPRVVAFMDIDPLADIDEALGIIDWACAQRALGAGVRWAIRDAAGGFIGTCGFNHIDVERGRRGEIAYDLSHAWWGRGVMTELLPALVDFGFNHLGLHRLEAMVTPGNDRSCRLLERQGFLRDGVLRGHAYWKGRYWDQIVYSRVASDSPIQ